MRIISNEELAIVAGSGFGGLDDEIIPPWKDPLANWDAAATRPPETNSWGETAADAKARENSAAPRGNLEKDMQNCDKGNTDCYEKAYADYIRALTY